jgi:hypothetical protein
MGFIQPWRIDRIVRYAPNSNPINSHSLFREFPKRKNVILFNVSHELRQGCYIQYALFA